MSSTLNGRERGELLRKAIFDAWAAEQELRQPNSLRPGEIGHECEFYLWLRFRWAVPPKRFEGRMLRLFDRGQREEPVIFSDLRKVGAQVWDRDPENPVEQISIRTFDGHSKGFLDGVGKDIPFATKEFAVIECKTHSRKSFDALRKDGVAVSKPQHYAQFQLYMDEHKLEEALYFAVCKDDDDIHCEFVAHNPSYIQALRFKGEKIIFRRDAPARMSRKAEFFKCKMCDARDVCHGIEKPQRNCRNCIEAMPKRDGTWSCSLHEKTLTLNEQRAGCEDHRYLPGILNGEVLSHDDEKALVTYALGPDKTEWTDHGPLEDRPAAPGGEATAATQPEPAES